jgi:hypothetical protein
MLSLLNSGLEPLALDRQTGQLALDCSHMSMHSWWNKCLQWSNLTISPSRIELRQIEHSSAFLIDSFFFLYSNTGNSAIANGLRPTWTAGSWWSSTALTGRLCRLLHTNHIQRTSINSSSKPATDKVVARRAVEVRQQLAASSPLVCAGLWLFIEEIQIWIVKSWLLCLCTSYIISASLLYILPVLFRWVYFIPYLTRPLDEAMNLCDYVNLVCRKHLNLFCQGLSAVRCISILLRGINNWLGTCN